jgi:hypothetical protein
VISLLRNRDGLSPSFLKRSKGRLLNTKSDVAVGFPPRRIAWGDSLRLYAAPLPPRLRKIKKEVSLFFGHANNFYILPLF